MSKRLARGVAVWLSVWLVVTWTSAGSPLAASEDVLRSNPRSHSTDALHPNVTVQRNGKGYFTSDSVEVLGWGKVVNFLSVGEERECAAAWGRAARSGLCLNAYECRQRGGDARGSCALGLGVCCVWEVSCGGVVQNNVSYWVSPGWPHAWLPPEPAPLACYLTVQRAHAGVTHLYIEFIHFNIAQPDRHTGACNTDVLRIGSPSKEPFLLCGQNHHQHLYYEFPSEGGSERQSSGELGEEEGEGEGAGESGALQLSVRGGGVGEGRAWLLRLLQLPLAHAPPHRCQQYYTAPNGTIRTFNYASNGRHLGAQEYRACVRRAAGKCAVQYRACHRDSFRIGYPGTGAGAAAAAGYPVAAPPQLAELDPEQSEPEPAIGADDEPALEGSGEGAPPPRTRPEVTPRPGPLLALKRWWNGATGWWGRRGRGGRRMRPHWGPYVQHYGGGGRAPPLFRYYGYGNFGEGLGGRYGRLRCTDRITIPCDSDHLLSNSVWGVGVCDPHHCGASLCAGQGQGHEEGQGECVVETSVTPFYVAVHFGPATYKKDPDDNIGACLTYTQLDCDS